MNRASPVYSANPKRSEGSVPGLEALTNGWSIKPGPERSEGAPSQKIGRELEASHMLPND